MNFTVRISSDTINALADLYVRRAERAASAAAEIARTDIIAQAERGIGTDEHRFAPYTPAYAKQRKRKGLRVSPPNLRVSGELLDTMTVRDGRLSVAPMQLRKAQGVFSKRPVFGGLGQRIRQIVQRRVSQIMAGK